MRLVTRVLLDLHQPPAIVADVLVVFVLHGAHFALNAAFGEQWSLEEVREPVVILALKETAILNSAA